VDGRFVMELLESHLLVPTLSVHDEKKRGTLTRMPYRMSVRNCAAAEPRSIPRSSRGWGAATAYACGGWIKGPFCVTPCNNAASWLAASTHADPPPPADAAAALPSGLPSFDVEGATHGSAAASEQLETASHLFGRKASSLVSLGHQR
jgi:hypothetical protein